MIALFLIVLPVVLAMIVWRTSRPKNLPPGPPVLPIIGSIPFIGKQLHLDLLKLQQKYGDTMSFAFGSKPIVVLNNFDTAKKVFSDEMCSGRDQNMIGADLLSKNGVLHGLVMSQNELWKEQRRFALSTLRDFGMGKSWLENAVLDEVSEVCDEISKRQGQAFDPKVIVSCGAANVICALIFGKRFSHDDERFQKLAVMTSVNIRDLESASLLDALPWLKWIPSPLTRTLDKVNDDQRVMRTFLEELVDEHQKSVSVGEADQSFIGAYNREADKRQSDEQSTFTKFQLISSLNDLFAAGSETTSTTMLWSLLFMIENPTVMRKVQQELRERIAQDEPVRMSDRALLPYTEATLMEIQRVATLVPINVPHINMADMTVDGYHIPKGTTIMTNNWFIHRDPRYWHNPDQFDPTRFLDKEGKVFRPDGFMPFSVGKRACLGESLAKMELWLFFSNIMHRFDFRLADGSTATSKDYNFAIVLSPNPYQVVFKVAA